MEKVWKIWNDHVKMDDHGDIYRMIMGIFTGSVGPAKCAHRAVAWKTSNSCGPVTLTPIHLFSVLQNSQDFQKV